MRALLERNNQLLKKLDFWVGIPLLYCFSLFRRRIKNKPEEVENIGIFAFAAIGDSILSSCLFAALKAKYPKAWLIVFASSDNAAVYRVLADYDELVILPITKPIKTLSILRTYSLDILIDTSQWIRLSALYSLWMHAKFRIGFKTSGQYRHIGYDSTVTHSESNHELENFKRLLNPLGTTTNGSPRLNLDLIQCQKLTEINIEKLKPYVVFHPWASGTGSEFRQWPMGSWAQLAKFVIANNFNVVITGSPQNQGDSLKLASLISDGCMGGRVFVIAGKTSLIETAKVILDATVVLSVNTGIAHLADHLQVPSISLNGPTNSARWGLVNPLSRNIDVPKSEGGGFLNLGFEYSNDKQYVMNKISVQEVLTLLKASLQALP